MNSLVCIIEFLCRFIYQILERSADCILLLTLRSGELYVCIGGGPAATASTGFVIGFVGMLRLHETAQKNTRSAAAFWNGVDLQIAVESVRISF